VEELVLVPHQWRLGPLPMAFWLTSARSTRISKTVYHMATNTQRISSWRFLRTFATETMTFSNSQDGAALSRRASPTKIGTCSIISWSGQRNSVTLSWISWRSYRTTSSYFTGRIWMRSAIGSDSPRSPKPRDMRGVSGIS
jgi:hypothetical protein